jgi:hypothetical protein
MIRVIRAELVKYRRRRFVALTVAGAVLFGAFSAAVTVLTADPGPARPGAEMLGIEALSTPGGGTAAALGAVGFGAVFMFATFIAGVAGEFTRGTLRTLLLQQPGRFRLLGGKLVTLVGVSAAALALAEISGWVVARLLAPSQDIDVSGWTSLDGLAAGVEDYGRLLLWLVGWAILGFTFGALARSVPVGVLAGLVWAGPVENIVADGWDPARRWFPGLLLRSLLAPETAAVSTGRALLTLGAYCLVAVLITGTAVQRRDVAGA